MPLLEGHFDPTLLNATVLQPILRDALISAMRTDHLQTIDVAQQVLDELAARKIIW